MCRWSWAGATIVSVLPITHVQPRTVREGVKIPAPVKRHLGLDDERSWIMVSEGNELSGRVTTCGSVRRPATCMAFYLPGSSTRIVKAFVDWHRQKAVGWCRGIEADEVADAAAEPISPAMTKVLDRGAAMHTRILQRATRSIDSGYFHLNIDGGDAVYRERVYCYELYHQMRLRWPRDTPYYLNGEIDKAAHPILMHLGAAHAKPDLLVHQPGYMTGNHAVIEVKTSRAGHDGIRNDLEKLSLFLKKVLYRRAIYLVYGYEADADLTERIRQISREIEGLAQIELWLQQEPGTQAECIALLQAAPTIAEMA